jgi:predicted HD phosphohydrolase
MNLRGSTENVGRVGHEDIGAAYLRSLGFSETVCRLVNSHVAAKRYCTFPADHEASSLIHVPFQ